MILIISVLSTFIPLIVVIWILLAIKHNRNRKKRIYSGKTEGRIDKIYSRGLEYPTVMVVTYFVDGIEYHIKETVKVKSEMIKMGSIPIGQRKAYRMGNLSVGSYVTVQYDLQKPKNAIIPENDGIMDV